MNTWCCIDIYDSGKFVHSSTELTFINLYKIMMPLKEKQHVWKSLFWQTQSHHELRKCYHVQKNVWIPDAMFSIHLRCNTFRKSTGGKNCINQLPLSYIYFFKCNTSRRASFKSPNPLIYFHSTVIHGTPLSSLPQDLPLQADCWLKFSGQQGTKI